MRGGLSIVALMLLATPVAAQDRLTVRAEPASGVDLGMTVRGTTASVFSISYNGMVTRLSGDAIRMSNAPVMPPRVVIQCLEDGRSRCSRSMRVRVTTASEHGRTAILRFRLGGVEGARLETAAAPQGEVLEFDLAPTGNGSTVSFSMGLDIRVGPGGGGREDFNYLVRVMPQ